MTMAAHDLAALRASARLTAYSQDTPSAREHSAHLTSRDVAMGWILAAMIAFGVAVGVVFPLVVGPLIDLHAGSATAFRVACIAAGFCVGVFAYGVARFTLYRANRRLAHLAAYDGLTSLFNQRQFARTLSTELLRAQRTGQQTSLIITDLDHFKQVNDRHGHAIGDDVLAAVARDVVASVRPFDIACRIGGEEFAVILPQTTEMKASMSPRGSGPASP
jgi:predicted signal transduction protein with EAL and GGDEF domain